MTPVERTCVWRIGAWISQAACFGMSDSFENGAPKVKFDFCFLTRGPGFHPQSLALRSCLPHNGRCGTLAMTHERIRTSSPNVLFSIAAPNQEAGPC